MSSDAPLVGRAEEMARLTRALDRARAGRPGAVLVSGDAGVGKTRLLTELARHARESGATVLVGHCVELGGVGLPYLPFAEALQQLAETSPPDSPAAEAIRARPALGRLLPRLRETRRAPARPPQRPGPPGQGPGPAPRFRVSGDDDLGQMQMFDAIGGLLGELAAETPVLLLVEDLHWAEQSTRDLLSFLLTRLRTEHLSVVISYRSDDLHRRHPLRPLLAELVRLPVVERLDLAPFTPPVMREYLRALQGGPVPETVVRRVIQRSEGNAFFAEELLVASLESDSATLPTGLADVLLARLEQLPPPAQHVARVAAVAGRRVEHALLQQVAGLSEVEIDEALREAVTRYVLVAEEKGTYAFRHALLQEAVYGDLLPGERSRLHATYARVLAEASDGLVASAAELAYHCLESHDLPGALVASVRAADEASTLHAPAEALRHLEQALNLWRAVPDAEQLVGMDAMRLGLRAAAAASSAGELHRAVSLARAVRDRADLAGDPELAATARHRLAYHLLGTERPEEALNEAGEALRLVPADPPSVVRVWTAATYARAAVNHDYFEDAHRFADEALAGARTLGVAEVEADALATLALLSELKGRVDEARDRLAEARERARAAGDLAVELRATYNLAANRFYDGDLAAAAAVIASGIERAEQSGLTWSGYGVELRVLQVIVLYAMGDWDSSQEAARIVGDGAPDPVVARLFAAALYVAVGRGAPGAAERVTKLRTKLHYDPQIVLLAGGCGADLLQWQGDVAGARAAVDDAIDELGQKWGPWQLGGIWLAALGVSAEADRAAEARLRRETAEERAAVAGGTALLEHARTTARLGRPRGATLGPEGRAWLERAEAEGARLRGEADPEAWQRSTDAFGYGYVYEQARSRWRLAEALLARDRRDEAAEQARTAYEAAVRLGATPLRDAVAALARRGRLEIGLPLQFPDDALLTPRERDVLKLLAEGRTNRQIGRSLFISEKTASVHVSNIIGKLGASGRTEAVAIAHRRGLLTPAPRQAAKAASGPPTAS